MTGTTVTGFRQWAVPLFVRLPCAISAGVIEDLELNSRYCAVNGGTVSEYETIYLSPQEIEATIKALVECGANRNQRRLIEVFHDPALVAAAQSARGELMKRQRSNRSVGPDYLRQLAKQQQEADRRRSALQSLRGDHADLLESVQRLLTSLLAVQGNLRDGHWLDARAAFDRALDEAGWDGNELADKLYELRNTANEDTTAGTDPPKG